MGLVQPCKPCNGRRTSPPGPRTCTHARPPGRPGRRRGIAESQAKGGVCLAALGWLTEKDQEPDYLRDFIFTFDEAIPEPSAGILFATGLLVCSSALRRRRA